MSAKNIRNCQLSNFYVGQDKKILNSNVFQTDAVLRGQSKTGRKRMNTGFRNEYKIVTDKKIFVIINNDSFYFCPALNRLNMTICRIQNFRTADKFTC